MGEFSRNKTLLVMRVTCGLFTSPSFGRSLSRHEGRTDASPAQDRVKTRHELEEAAFLLDARAMR